MPNKPSRIFQLPWRTRNQIVRDVDAELAFHLEMRVSELVAAGADPEQRASPSRRGVRRSGIHARVLS